MKKSEPKKLTKKQLEQLGKDLKNPNVEFKYADKVIIETRPFKKNARKTASRRK
ncbi:MAG TPA: hypothetical protein VN026_11465 [Bacteroidia bacterium]|nr:hypothetical protein [Bacteroidia bacterium]